MFAEIATVLRILTKSLDIKFFRLAYNVPDSLLLAKLLCLL